MTLALILLITFIITTALLVRRTLAAQALRDRVDAYKLNLLPSDWDDYPPND